MQLYNTLAEITDACNKFYARGQSLQNEAHKIACSVLAHVEQHSDIRVVSKFLATMPELSRVNALRSWFEEFGPIAFEKNAPVFVKGKATHLNIAMAMPFWKFKQEQPYQPVDAAKALDKLIKRLTKDMKETGIDHNATIQALRLVPVAKPVVVETAETVEVVAVAA
jgi:hypothetical protein